MGNERCGKCNKAVYPWQRRTYKMVYPTIGDYHYRAVHYPCCEHPEEVKAGERITPSRKEG